MRGHLAALERDRARGGAPLAAARRRARRETTMTKRPAPMQRDADPFARATSRSSKTAIDDRSAITGIANMLSDAVPAGRKRSTPIHSRNPNAGRRARRRRPAASRRSVALHCVAGSGEHERQQRERQHAEQHLPRDEVEQVEARARAGNTSSRPCPPPSRNPTARPTAFGARSPCQCHGSTTSVSPASAKRDRDPLHAAHALAQHRPRDEQRPERHREHEHRRRGRRRRRPPPSSSSRS